LLRKNGVYGLPTIPSKLKQCDNCILGKQAYIMMWSYAYSFCKWKQIYHDF
jgi:hypothetical protein